MARVKHTIDVHYTCQGCGLKRRAVAVQERFAEEERPLTWMRYVEQTVTNDHARLSPGCPALACDLEIPLASRAAPIGQAERRRHSG